MKKSAKKFSALILAIIIAIPMQLLGVFAQDIAVEDKFTDELKRVLAETRDEAEKVSVSIYLVKPDDSLLDQQVIEEYGELLTQVEYYKIYGFNDYYENYLEPREEYRRGLQEELILQNNKKFMEENGLQEENLINKLDFGGIDIWLTVQELYDIAAKEEVSSVVYYDTTPHEPDIDYSIEIVTVGDVNKDGQITAFDAFLIQRYLVGYESFTEQQRIYIADVNLDNEVTTTDALEILRYVVGYHSDSAVNTSEETPREGYVYEDPTGDSEVDVAVPD